jgi:hypothetical protein
MLLSSPEEATWIKGLLEEERLREAGRAHTTVICRGAEGATTAEPSGVKQRRALVDLGLDLIHSEKMAAVGRTTPPDQSTPTDSSTIVVTRPRPCRHGHRHGTG